MRLSRRTVGLTLLALVALGLRLGVVWAVTGRAGLPVCYEHGEIAENLLAGRGFTVRFLGVTGPTSQQAPFFPLLLAGAYAVFGVDSLQAVLAMQALAAVAGAALVLCVVWLAWSLVPEWPTLGWVAGWGAALYPPHVYMVTHLQVAPWAALCLTLLLAVAVSPPWRRAGRKVLAAGALAGLLPLIDPILALALPFAMWIYWRSETHGSRLQSAIRNPQSAIFQQSAIAGQSAMAPLFRLATTAFIAAAVVAPWLWRNYRVHGELVFVKSTFGYAFWQGNNEASWGSDKIPKPSAEALRTQHDGTPADMHRALWAARRETLYIDDVLLAPGGYREFAGLTEPERSRLLGRRAWQFVGEHPGRYVQLCARRLRYFLLFDETNPKAAHPVYRAATVTWLVLAFVGFLVIRPKWRVLWPPVAIFATVTLFHTLTIVSARFRIPIEPLSFVWAAAAVAPLVDCLAPRFLLRRAVAAAPAVADCSHALQGPHHRLRAKLSNQKQHGDVTRSVDDRDA